MQVTFQNLDRISKRGRIIGGLAFKAPLPAGYYDAYIMVIHYRDQEGNDCEGVLRASNGNVRCFRAFSTLEKCVGRWGLPGIYISITQRTAAENKLKFLSADDWEQIKSSQAMPDYSLAGVLE